MDRLTQLASEIDARLRHFEAIDLREDSSYGCGSLSDNPYFPKLYLNGRRDPELMNIPGEGSAK